MFSKGGEVSSTANSRASSKHFGKLLIESGTSFAILKKSLEIGKEEN